MQPKSSFSQLSLEQMVEQIFTYHKMTRADQQHFMSVMFAKNFLNAEDRKLIDRVFDGLQKGLIRVMD